ncbi:MAG TPA: hypothetical protein VFH08_04370 [Chitinophagaceae bacterium]|nr:hypothetical protein [Chitinophagaceae bacterium]
MTTVILRPSFTVTCLLIFFISCKQSITEKERWAIVINFFSPDTTYYPPTTKFPFPDSLRFASLTSIFSNHGKLPIINDSKIIFYDNYRENGQDTCCIQDSLEVYIDSIRGKKYLFAIGDYITVFQSNNNSDTNLRTRKTPVAVPLWDIKLNTPYPPEKFKNEYEKLGARSVKLSERFDEVSKQKWNENDSISVETIQFANSADRMITALSKDINETEVNSLIENLKNKYPDLIYKEAIQIDSDGKPFKIIRLLLQGVSISFTQFSATEYTFMITDYYETIKLIINNAGISYIFRDDVRIY